MGTSPRRSPRVWEHDRYGVQGDNGGGASVGTRGRSIAELLAVDDRSGSGRLVSGLPSYGGSL